MVQTLVVLGIVVLLIAWVLGAPFWHGWRRRRLKQRPFPPLWAATLAQQVPLYGALPPMMRQQLQGYMQVFLAEKQFIGCNGLTVTPEMKVTIAAIACLLLLNEREQYFPKLRSVLVYPTAYWVYEAFMDENGIVQERRVARLGESWTTDQVVLSWEQVQYDTAHWQDGHNVVLHEFAHQLDQEDGTAEGVPILRTKADYEAWATTMSAAFRHLCQALEQGKKTVLDPYGATNPAEFFAVATETFFEMPTQLYQDSPLLYDLLQRYYCLDPKAWRLPPL